MYPWQQSIYQQLTDAFLNGRGHHALLFRTDVGLGTENLIHHFAHWLLCQQPNGEQPCQQCKSCLLMQSGNHPDFHLIQPIEGKDIGIDQIREMTTKLQNFSQQGGSVVVYIKGVDRLTEASSNALLKTLEEPPQGVYFLLEAPLQSTMLATIQSRCQTWVLYAPKPEYVLEWLQAECPNATNNDLEIALRICHSRPLICKTFIKNDRLLQRKTFLQTFWRFYKSRDVMLLFTAFNKEKEEVLQQLEWLESFFSDALKAKMGISTGWLNPDLQNGIIPFSQQLTPHGLLQGHQILQQTQRDLVEVNAVNQELMLLDCLTKLVMVFE
ncbi:DNA polymerase III subunit delta' [Mannheimia sp. AT1]|uniref:DNA polymerase III subunit delta' n=1 Tax=Mannheimia cairinae TaxID=3025936 RepID=A0ABT5MPW9_9PAST|nr:DNA polymerase III subunit delta' [Mannheimia cairinae]MDD0824027.1 DNA polymerase III subunit delta' [Mannheimia cairinae]MDD0827143.1 DNA polymerase III subunit delta' [Mannheimia cairinae]